MFISVNIAHRPIQQYPYRPKPGQNGKPDDAPIKRSGMGPTIVHQPFFNLRISGFRKCPTNAKNGQGHFVHYLSSTIHDKMIVEQ